MKYQFEYKLTEQDYLNFNEFHFFNSPANKAGIYFWRWSIFWIFIVLSVLLASTSRFVFSGISLGVSLVYVFGLNRYYKWRIRSGILHGKKYEKLPYPENALLQFGEDAIIEVTPGIEMKIKYTALTKIATNCSTSRDCIYIYHNATQAFLIPFSVFEGEQQRTKFLEFINSKIPQGATL